MSELQIALIGIGALIILAVLAINWWQERRFHHQVEKSFAPLKRDALLDEPTLNDSGLDVVSEKSADKRSDTFSIDKISAEVGFLPETKPEISDRFVNLTKSDAIEPTFGEDNSIESTYNQLIKSKIEKLSSNLAETIANHQPETPRKKFSEQSNAFKEVFSEDTALQQEASFNSSPENVNFLNSVQKTSNPSIFGVNKLETPQQESQDTAITLPDMLHGQIDLTALLYLATETSVSTLSNALLSLFDGFDKPVFVHVLDSNKQWHLLKDLQSNQEALNRLISKVACSLQLADRGGAVARNTLNRFQLAVETLGLGINGHVEWQEKGDALNAANSLDLFCIEVDKTIGFHLVHGESGPFTGTKLRGLAESQGLLLTSDGSFKYFDESSDEKSASKQILVKTQLHPSFVMFNRDDHPFSPEMLRTSVVKGITFQLDIPHVRQCAEMFNRMVQVAEQLELSLGAVLVDDNNKVLGDIQIEKIRQQLKVIQANMLVRGIVPGSDCAHRLFS